MNKGHKRNSHQNREDLAGEYRGGDVGQQIFLFIFIIGLISDMLFLKFSDSWQYFFPWYYRVVIFLILIFTAAYFAQKAHKKIFKEERKKLMVIDTDVYSIMRHPMYFGSILSFFAFVILSLSVVAFVIFINICIFYFYLCRYEEKILIEKLGDEYKDYMKKVPMLIPKIRK